MNPAELPMHSSLVGENLAGRPGGSVSLAVGMSYVFYKIPGLSNLMGYWYHFCIMFEALFILTTIDAGTRIGRYLLQDLCGQIYKPLGKKDSWFNIIFFSAAISVSWGYLLITGNISTIWPLFGTSNQMLAIIAFAVGTTFLIRSGKRKYAWITFLPMIFVMVTTLSAAVINITDNFIPNHLYLLTVISGSMIIIVTALVIECAVIWSRLLREDEDADGAVLENN
jgi:carbon starvation protein